MIDSISPAGAWDEEIARQGSHGPLQADAPKNVVGLMLEQRRTNPEFALGNGDIRLTRDDQEMLARLYDTLAR